MQNALRKITQFTDTINSVTTHLNMLQPTQALKMNQELLRASIGSIREWQRLQAHTSFTYDQRDEIRRICRQLTHAERDFYRPEVGTAITLLQQWQQSNENVVESSLKRYNTSFQGIQKSLAAFNTSWLHTKNEMDSIGGLVALHGIGQALKTMPAFDTRLVRALRSDLGDWRKRVVWPSDIFTNPLARSSFYLEQGLNPTLTAFPADAFSQIVLDADIRGSQPSVAEEYNFPSKRGDTPDIVFDRTHYAYVRIRRIETQLRKFIDEKMREVFGDKWTKHQIPGGMRGEWMDKRQKALDNGECAWPLIAYADFSDYIKIITRKDNWEKAFKSFFRSKASVQESFNRLFPIRICVMHSRAITQDDDLYLLVETLSVSLLQ